MKKNKNSHVEVKAVVQGKDSEIISGDNKEGT